MLYLLSPFSLSQLSSPPCILFGVCIFGIFLAVTSEERDFFVDTDISEQRGQGISNGLGAMDKNFKYKEGKSDSLLYFLLDYALALPIVDSIVTILVTQYLALKLKIGVFYTALQLKRIAASKRHFFYLLEKKTLNLEIRPGENEIDSYLDCKRSVGKGWPFMWEVSQVKDTTVTCDGYPCIPMSSYSYLDLLRNESVQEAAIQAAKKWATGNHGPRMLGGNMQILVDLERVIAKFLRRDATLLCSSGYLATMSAVAAVSSESTVIFADSRIHASLKAGLKIGDGKYFLFKHNNFQKCEELVAKHRHKYQSAWMVIESVYSMDGDICDLPAAHRLCKKFNMDLLIDEAHGLGVLGASGRGVEEHFGMIGCATLIVGTFSKSVASIGGYITGPKRLIDYFDFHAPGNVFSAPLPAYCAGAAIRSFQFMDSHREIITKAQKNAKRLRELLANGAGHWPSSYPEENKYLMEGDEATMIMPLIFKDDIDRVMRIATRMKERGYMISAVAYPACPLRTPRFRITATSAYTEDMMQTFVKSLVQVCVEEKASPQYFNV